MNELDIRVLQEVIGRFRASVGEYGYVPLLVCKRKGVSHHPRASSDIAQDNDGNRFLPGFSAMLAQDQRDRREEHKRDDQAEHGG